MLNENIKNVLANGMWNLATCADEYYIEKHQSKQWKDRYFRVCMM